jgi:hypothetical protein
MPKAQPLLLDLFPSASVAYSLRKLRTAYTGNCIRVRRTDLTEQDIGFNSSGQLDTVALLSFVGTGALNNGFVTTWYDQSGNGNNMIQNTIANQPRIVLAGAVELLSTGLPAIYSGRLMTSVNFQFNDSSIIGVFKQPTGEVAGARLVDHDFANGFWLGRNTNGSQSAGGGWRVGSSPFGIFQSIANNTKCLIFAYRNGAVSNVSINNNSFSSITTSSAITNSNKIAINVSITGLNSSLKHVSEIIIYSTNQSSNFSGINSNVNSYYTIF